MSVVNGVMGPLFDWILYPFRSVHPLIGLTIVSAVCAVLMLLGFRATSDQEGLAAVKRKIAAGIFEIRLYNDDILAILRAQAALLRHNLTYMRLNVVPMLWMIVPFVLVVAQLQFHYGYRGLQPGDSTTLRVTLAESAVPASGAPEVDLDVPEGLRVDSPSVWIPSEREIAWRLVVEDGGVHELGVALGGDTWSKRVVASEQVLRRSPWRLQAGFLDQLLYPAESPLPADAPVAQIAVDYPDREVGLWGWDGHWLIAFLILTIGLAYALKGFFGVTI
ncbi:MAG: hypothetical protein ACOC5E_00425 [Acidobacteriota bacterium]